MSYRWNVFFTSAWMLVAAIGVALDKPTPAVVASVLAVANACLAVAASVHERPAPAVVSLGSRAQVHPDSMGQW